MAEKKATLVLELKNFASQQLNAFEKQLQGLKTSYLEITAALATVSAFIVKSITEFAEQEAAAKRLELALTGLGENGAKASERLSELAVSLSKTTGFSNTTITSFQALLANMGFNEAAITQLTPRVLNLARAMGVDASQAAMLIGRSIETGSTMGLKRMGVVVDESAFKARDFGRIVQELDKNGRATFAENFGNTSLGAIQKFKSAMEDLFEEFGKFLAEALIPLLNHGTKLLQWLANFAPAVRIVVAEIKLLWTIVLESVKAIGSLAAVIDLALRRDFKGAAAAAKQGWEQWKDASVDALTKAGDAINKAYGQIGDNLAGKGGAKKAGGKAGGTPNLPGDPTQMENDAYAEQSVKRKILQLKGYHLQAQRLEMEHEARLLTIKKRGDEGRALLDAFYRKSLIDGASKMFGNLSALQNSKNKEMAAVGKAAAVAQATISTFTAANEAYQALAFIPIVGPELGAAAAAAAIVSGLANVAQINGVQLAHGGIVLPRPGGVQATIGEAGQAEAVIPLGSSKAKEMLGGGGSTHIHVGTLVADQMGLEEFARRLDKELFRLRRNRQTNAF